MDFYYSQPEQHPFTIKWPVELFKEVFFNSSLSSLLSEIIFAVTDRRRNKDRLASVIRGMEDIGFLVRTIPPENKTFDL